MFKGMAVRWEQIAERSMEVASKVSPLAGAKGPGGPLATCSKQQPHRDHRTESLLKAAGLVGHLLWGHWAAAALKAEDEPWLCTELPQAWGGEKCSFTSAAEAAASG